MQGGAVQSADVGLAQPLAEVGQWLFAHAVGDEVGSAVAQDAFVQSLVPVVIVGESSQRGLYASQDDGGVGEEFAEYAAVGNGCPFGAHVMSSVGGIGIFAT